MIDWNRYMCEALEKLAYDPKKQEKKFNEKIDKEKKKFLNELEKQTPSKKTHSEEMQDNLEPIPISCPMDEYYDDEETNNT